MCRCIDNSSPTKLFPLYLPPLGLADGVTYPAMNSLFSAWSPPMERSRLSTIAFGGAQLGTIVTLPIGGLLCQYVRWDSVFYLTGLLGIIWAALWMYLISDTPSSCRFIKTDEKVLSSLYPGVLVFR